MGSEKNTLKAVIPVKGMTCDHCVTTIEKALDKTIGISKVNAKLDSGEVSVEYDPGKIGLDKIKKIISELGYTYDD